MVNISSCRETLRRLAVILILFSHGEMAGAQKRLPAVAEHGEATTPRADLDHPVASARDRPNIVIILADDMGYGDVSRNNTHARTGTPSIDALGETGISFTDAHSGGAVCIPSRYGLVTGRYFFRAPQQRGRLGYLAPFIEPRRETIGSLMQRAGYTTACIGKWHLGLNWQLKDDSKSQLGDPGARGYTNTDFTGPVGGGPASLGFDHSFILPASLDMPPYVFIKNGVVVDADIILTTDKYPRTLKGTLEYWDRKHTNEQDVYWDHGVWWRDGEMSASFRMEECLTRIVDEGVRFIKEQARQARQASDGDSKPFMLYLPLTGPHTPWLPGDEFEGRTKMGTYGDFILQVDHAVHRITETLRNLVIEENTLVVFTSDNGSPWPVENTLTYGHESNLRRGQKGDAWDGGHHIPLFIKWPAKIRAPRTYSHTVSLVDLMATFAELTGQPVKNGGGEDSFSFSNVLSKGSQDPSRDHVVYISSSGKLAVKKGEWKLIEGLGSGGFTKPVKLKPARGGPEGQLYNLKEDPMETVNLYLDHPSKVAELFGLLDQIRQDSESPSEPH